MSKPIFIVRFPLAIPTEALQGIRLDLEKKLDDYHILVCKDGYTGSDIRFECFNSPHTEMEFEELKERILLLIKDNGIESGSPS